MELGWDARARYAFFSTYIGGFTRSMGEVAHHYRTAGAFDHLSASVEAASLAFMATQLGSPHLMRLASASYLTAIQRLSRGLPELDSDRAEEALQSVLLLDMYEKMVHRDPRTSQSWMSHARGGLSLLSTQTSSIVSSTTGCHLAARLVTAVTVSCATVGVNTPKELNLLRRSIGYRFTGPKWSFLGVLGRVSDLQLDLEKGAIYQSEFVVRAKALDDQLESLIRNLPLEWLPRRVPVVDDAPDILDGHYDVYPDHYTTQVSNALRTMRLIIYQLFTQYVPDHDYLGEERIRHAIRESTHRICASVPQFMLPGAALENSLPFSPVQLLRCSTFLTPLYFVNQVTEDTSVRQWVARCLRFMWESGGLRAAKEIADVVEARPNLDYWTVFAMTGSYAFAA